MPKDVREDEIEMQRGSENSGAGDLRSEDEIEDELDEPTETPFDHPLFLPAICAGLWVWFGYDGFLNQDPEMIEHVAFNRWGFYVLTVLTSWFGYKGWKDLRLRRESAGTADSPPPS